MTTAGDRRDKPIVCPDAASAENRASAEILATTLLIACALAHVVATRLSWARIPLQTDTGIWAYIGGRILNGALPYRDLWESKPPGIYYTFAALEWLFGRGTDTAFLWLDAVLNLAVFAATYAVARFFASRIASAGGILILSFVFCHRVLADWGDNVEKFVALFEMIACYLVLRSSRSKRNWFCWLLAGICCGLASLFKQTGILLLVAALFTALWLGLWTRERMKIVLGRVALLIIGASLLWLPVGACLWRARVFPDFWHQAVLYDLVRVGSSEVERSRLGDPEHWSSVLGTLKLAAILFGPAVLGAILSLRECRLSTPPASTSAAAADRKIMLVLVYWLLATTVFPFAPYGYGHYMLQAAPPAAVLAARALSGPGGTRKLCSPVRARIVAFVLILPGLWPLADHFRFTFDSSNPHRKAYSDLGNKTHQLTDLIKQHSEPNELVMLWPPDYAVSYYARRRTPLEASNSDVIFKDKIGRLSPPMPDLLAKLTNTPPDLIVDISPLRVEMPPPGQSEYGPILLAPRSGVALIEPPDDNHPAIEGRILAPLKAWVWQNYGGQERLGPSIVYYRGRPWRAWQDVLWTPSQAGRPQPTTPRATSQPSGDSP